MRSPRARSARLRKPAKRGSRRSSRNSRVSGAPTDNNSPSPPTPTSHASNISNISMSPLTLNVSSLSAYSTSHCVPSSPVLCTPSAEHSPSMPQSSTIASPLSTSLSLSVSQEFPLPMPSSSTASSLPCTQQQPQQSFTVLASAADSNSSPKSQGTASLLCDVSLSLPSSQAPSPPALSPKVHGQMHFSHFAQIVASLTLSLQRMYVFLELYSVEL